MTEHKLNQCANDWIMCTCGKLFSDKEKFLQHLEDNNVDGNLIMDYELCINGGSYNEEKDIKKVAVEKGLRKLRKKSKNITKKNKRKGESIWDKW